MSSKTKFFSQKKQSIERKAHFFSWFFISLSFNFSWQPLSTLEHGLMKEERICFKSGWSGTLIWSVRQIGHRVTLWWQSLQIMWPFVHWLIGPDPLGVKRQIGHSRIFLMVSTSLIFCFLAEGYGSEKWSKILFTLLDMFIVYGKRSRWKLRFRSWPINKQSQQTAAKLMKSPKECQKIKSCSKMPNYIILNRCVYWIRL